MTAARRLPVVILFSAAMILALNMGVRQTFGLFIGPMTPDLGMSHGSFALAIGVQNLLWGMLTPLCGMVADRYGSGRVLAAGGLVYVAGLLVMALGGTAFSLHLSAGIMIGVAISASGIPLVLAAVARSVTPERRSMALAIAATGFSAGQFVLLPFTQLLIDGFGWQSALLVLAALTLLIVPFAAALAGKPAADPAARSQSMTEAIAEAGRHKGFLLLTAGFFVCGFHVSFIGTHLPGYIVTCNLSPLVGATALGIVGFFNIIGGLLTGPLGARYRRKNLLAIIYLLRAVVIAAFLLGPKTELAVWIFAASFGLLWLSTVPLTSGLVGHLFGPRYMATLFGITMFSHQVGAFLGAWLGGVSYDLTGSYDSVWLVSVGLGLLAAALHWPIVERPVAEPAAGPA